MSFALSVTISDEKKQMEVERYKTVKCDLRNTKKQIRITAITWKSGLIRKQWKNSDHDPVRSGVWNCQQMENDSHLFYFTVDCFPSPLCICTVQVRYRGSQLKCSNFLQRCSYWKITVRRYFSNRFVAFAPC